MIMREQFATGGDVQPKANRTEEVQTHAEEKPSASQGMLDESQEEQQEELQASPTNPEQKMSIQARMDLEKQYEVRIEDDDEDESLESKGKKIEGEEERRKREEEEINRETDKNKGKEEVIHNHTNKDNTKSPQLGEDKEAGSPEQKGKGSNQDQQLMHKGKPERTVEGGEEREG